MLFSWSGSSCSVLREHADNLICFIIFYLAVLHCSISSIFMCFLILILFITSLACCHLSVHLLTLMRLAAWAVSCRLQQFALVSKEKGTAANPSDLWQWGREKNPKQFLLMLPFFSSKAEAWSQRSFYGLILSRVKSVRLCKSLKV